MRSKFDQKAVAKVRENKNAPVFGKIAWDGIEALYLKFEMNFGGGN